MIKPDPRTTFDELLAQTDWVRKLARSLLKDETRVDDVVQQTLLTALEHAPKEIRSWRAWLTTVLQNVIRRDERSRQRRLRRELLAHEEAVVPSPGQIAERETVRRQVIAIVMDLAEPYRSTLLLRFYEDLSPIDIARHLGIPDATVRVRLMRGLKLVRDHLVESRDCNQGDWRGALVMLLGPMDGAVPWALGRVRDGSAATASGSLASSGIWVTLAVAAMLLAGGGWWMLRDPAGARDLGAVAASSDVSYDGATRNLQEVSAERTASDAAPREITPLLFPPRKPRALASIRGVLLHCPEAQPISSVQVTALPDPGALAFDLAVGEDRATLARSVRSDARGEFTLEGLSEGPYRLEVHTADRVRVYQAAALQGGSFLQLWINTDRQILANQDGLRVQVTDSNGRVVEGAQVELHGRDRAHRFGLGHAPQIAATDAQGFALLRVADLLRGVVIARLGGAAARVDFATDGDLLDQMRWRAVPEAPGTFVPALTLRLQPTGSITGRMVGGTGTIQALACSYDKTLGASARVVFSARASNDGSFWIDSLPSGRYLLDVQPDDRRQVLDVPSRSTPFGVDYEPSVVVVEPGSASAVELTLREGACLDGIVQDLDGRPIADARVRATLPQGPLYYPLRERRGGIEFSRLDESVDFVEWSPFVVREARTDGEGRYEFAGLRPGPDWIVHVFADGLSFDRRSGIGVSEGARVQLEHRLEPCGVLQGVGWEKASIGLRRVGEFDLCVSLLLPRETLAAFTIAGLRPGDYELFEIGRGEAVNLRQPLGKVTIEAGKLSFVDLRAVAPAKVSGRLTWHGLPVAGAVLDFADTQSVTDVDGRFSSHGAIEGALWFDLNVAAIPGAAPLRVSISDATSAEDLRLPEGRIDACLRGADGSRRTGRVQLTPILSAQDEAEWHALLRVGGCKDLLCARTDTQATLEDGSARFEMLPPGDYVLVGMLPDGSCTAPRRVRLSAGEVVNVDLVLDRAPTELQILVRDAAGDPRCGVSVEVFLVGDKGLSGCVANTRSDGAGIACFSGLPAGPLAVVAGERWMRDRPQAVAYPTPLPPIAGIPDGLQQVWKERKIIEQRPGPYVLRNELCRRRVELQPGQHAQVEIEF